MGHFYIALTSSTRHLCIRVTTVDDFDTESVFNKKSSLWRLHVNFFTWKKTFSNLYRVMTTVASRFLSMHIIEPMQVYAKVSQQINTKSAYASKTETMLFVLLKSVQKFITLSFTKLVLIFLKSTFSMQRGLRWLRHVSKIALLGIMHKPA